MPSKPLPPWLKPVWVRKPTMALLSWTRSGLSGPSAETAPLAPCAEIVPGPLESSRPKQDLVGEQLLRARAAGR